MPACHLSTKLWKSSWLALPAAVIGVVAVFGLAKISMNILNFGSGVRSGDCADDGRRRHVAQAVGEQRPAPASSVVRYLISSHACVLVLGAFGMPMMLPVT